MRRATSIILPSETEFLSNKAISDRVYAYILLNGEVIEKDTYIDKNLRGAAKNIGIDYHTLRTKIATLVGEGYLEEYDFKYKVVVDRLEYRKYVKMSILKELYLTKIDNIIKVYIYLGNLYSTYKERAWFNYTSLLNAIGYYSKRNKNNQDKMKVILEKLSELGLIKFSRMYETGDKYQIKFKLMYVETRKEMRKDETSI